MGTMSEKSESDSEKSGVRAGNSDMKVNVMYRGMVYRVRGIKVLCSVVTAVILLLVAIVGLGVWMLVSAYAEDKAKPFPDQANATKLTGGTETPSSTPYTIDFNAPSATLEEVSLPALVPHTVPSEDLYVNEAIGHFQGVTPSKDLVATSPRDPAPDPDFGLFGGLEDVGDSRSQVNSPPQPQPDVEDSLVQHSDTNPIRVPAPPHRHSDTDPRHASAPSHLYSVASPGDAPPSLHSDTGPDHAPPPLHTVWDHTHIVPGADTRQREEYTYDESPVTFGEPILQGGLPDNIPRDIDPMLLDMGLPFPYPPSIPTTRPPYRRTTTPLPRRPTYPNYGAERQRTPPRRRPAPPYFEYEHDYDVQPAGVKYEDHDHYHTPSPIPHTPNQPTITPRPQTDFQTEPASSTTVLDSPDTRQGAPGAGRLPSGLSLPPGVTLPSWVNLPPGVTLPGELEGLRKTAEEGLGRLPKGPGSYLDYMLHFNRRRNRTRPATTTYPPTTENETPYSHRTGPTEDRETDSGYTGPPVVGYGDRPPRTRPDPVFQHFWDVYGYDGKAPARHDDRGPVPEEFWGPEASHPQDNDRAPPQSGGPRPVQPGLRSDQFRRRFNAGPPHPKIRGPRPDGQGYPLPWRPDAERPAVLTDQNSWPGQDRPYPARSGPSANRPRPSHPRPEQVNRRMGPADQVRESSDTRPRPQDIRTRPSRPRPGLPNTQPGGMSTRPLPSPPPNHRPFLGPLYDIYDYSKRLASTLLSFPAALNSRYNSSRSEYMRNEVELLEDYNRVFQNPNTSSADVLPDMFDDRPSRNERLMLIDSSKLRSLSPFELSLITWTFLDFWEFLIEKVGTLSKEDLRLLEQRLERLRQKKDRVMTQSFVTATADQRIAQDSSDTSFPDISRAIAMAEELLRNLPGVAEVARSATSTPETPSNSTSSLETSITDSSDEFEGRMWDPLGVFNSEERVKFMEFAIKVLFKFGRVYLTKNYALDCMMLLFCKDLNSGSRKDGMDGMAAKIKSVGLKVLTVKDTSRMDTMGEIWRSLTAWETLQCEAMFPRCDGPKALEIVNDVALGSRRK